MCIHHIVLKSRMIVSASLLILIMPLTAQQQQSKPSSHTQVVLLGTGTPAADPDRSGPSTAIIE